MRLSPLAVRQSLAIPEMERVARALAALLQAGDIVTLKGEVGAGKTTFARALIEAIAVDDPQVTSPTFNLMQSYEVRLANGREETLWHLDLYRLSHAREVEELGLRDLLPHILLVEWPEIIEAMIPQDRLSLALEFGETEATRTLTLQGGDSWKNRIGKSDV